MNVVLLIQAGDDGPVKIVQVDGHKSTDRAVLRAVGRLQEGSVELLHVRAVLDGDERLELDLRRAWATQRGERDWYAPVVLAHVPEDVARLELHDETRRVALVQLRGMA